MKKLFILLLLAATLAACKKDPEPHFIIDPDAKVYVKPSQNDNSIKTTSYLSSLEIVKQATVLRGYNTDVAGSSHLTWSWVGKDTVSDIPALLRWGRDIIYDTTGYGDYGLLYEFIDAYDLVICRVIENNYDTIAYIPNANMIASKNAIIEAYNSEDSESVYELFQNSFSFVPTTGSEYKYLKEMGLN